MPLLSIFAIRLRAFSTAIVPPSAYAVSNVSATAFAYAIEWSQFNPHVKFLGSSTIPIPHFSNIAWALAMYDVAAGDLNNHKSFGTI